MTRFDPLSLNREVRSAAQEWRNWRRRLKAAEGLDQDPLGQHYWTDGEERCRLAGRQTFLRVAELAAKDPLQKPLLRWVYRLAEQRINRDLLVHLTTLERMAPVLVQFPEYGQFTRRELLLQALREPGRRGQWLSAWASTGGELAHCTAVLWERRRELASGFGLASPDEIELPGPHLAEVAEAWLLRTQSVLPELGFDTLAGLLDVSLASSAQEGWPGRLVPRTVLDLVGPTGLFDVANLDPGGLPDLIAPASFLRALCRLGASWVDATAPRHQPFVVAHDPYGLERRTSGAFWGMLPLSEPYAKRVLRLAGARLAKHQRALWRSLFVESRVAAFRVLLRGPALAGKQALIRAFQDLLPRALGIELPDTLAGVCFRPQEDDAQRFAGLLLAVRRQATFCQTYDRDWFRNPHAIDELRGLTELSPDPEAPKAALEAGMDAFFQELETQLG